MTRPGGREENWVKRGQGRGGMETLDEKSKEELKGEVRTMWGPKTDYGRGLQVWMLLAILEELEKVNENIRNLIEEIPRLQ